jgi:hypothetical protein
MDSGPSEGSYRELRMMRTIQLIAIAGLILASTVGEAVGEGTINERKPARRDGIVEVLNANGTVLIVGWDRDEVEVRASLGEGAERLAFSSDENRTTVEVVTPDADQEIGNSHVRVRVPKESQVEAGTVNADIHVVRVQGLVFLQSVTGDIRVKDGPREVDAKSLRGEVEISVSRARVKASSAGGRVTLRETTGEADVSTVSGNVVVEGGTYERGRFKTISGDLRFGGGLEANGVFEFTSHGGTIDLILPEAISADILLSTHSGEIENEFEVKRGPGRRPRGMQGKRLAFSTTKGTAVAGGAGLEPGSLLLPAPDRARVVARSFSGNVKVTKKEE